MKINDQIICKITGIQPYGVFVSYGEYSGLIHISELSDQFVSSIEEILCVGEEVEVSVLEIDEENKRLKLSYKKAHPVHPKIQKMVKIKKGFHSLSKALPHWIEKTKNRG
ncbi:S1 RNA-binding domain-containing protein [Peloplasma aerotolerans]|jgi:general stress protein 13|uniref:S1 RNA-binding domain-containing protein n=1 Tax=Peloplasma aerotolerans TaxID=3044389 RepID=A0AAW6U7U8_9MOLU|nr:S1 RNA-binding domain-containing protein [Mariniplasma sp. M4Ah]MDI6452148.1 S1 RNA-binding domain-containing protein [Mariniplasma sp. M4Ah]